MDWAFCECIGKRWAFVLQNERRPLDNFQFKFPEQTNHFNFDYHESGQWCLNAGQHLRWFKVKWNCSGHVDLEMQFMLLIMICGHLLWNQAINIWTWSKRFDFATLSCILTRTGVCVCVCPVRLCPARCNNVINTFKNCYAFHFHKIWSTKFHEFVQHTTRHSSMSRDLHYFRCKHSKLNTHFHNNINLNISSH